MDDKDLSLNMLPKQATAAATAAVVVVLVTFGASALALVLPCSCRVPPRRGRARGAFQTNTNRLRQALRFASPTTASEDVGSPIPEPIQPTAQRSRNERDKFAKSGGRIWVERVIMAPPNAVKAAWMNQMRLLDVTSHSESPPTTTTESRSPSPLLWSRPSVVEESEQHVRCQVHQWGVFLRWLEDLPGEGAPSSHPAVESTVRFLPMGGGGGDGDGRFDYEENPAATPTTGDVEAACRLVWQLDLKTQYPQLVRPLARWRMSAVVDGVQGRLSEPRLFTRRMRIPITTSSPSRDVLEIAMDAWFDFVWIQGGGLPIPFAPFILPSRTNEPQITDESISKRLIRRVIVPPGLVERVVAVDGDKHEVVYQVDNPGWFTYQVHTHRGLVRFLRETTADAGNTVLLEWKVEIRPYAGCGAAVEFFTEAVVNTLSRNLAVHISEPGAVVRVSPPRGKGRSFASVRKDSWLGGVLASHLSDTRTTAQQTMSMFQPWTWGRARDEPAAGASSIWSNGTLDD